MVDDRNSVQSLGDTSDAAASTSSAPPARLGGLSTRSPRLSSSSKRKRGLEESPEAPSSTQRRLSPPNGINTSTTSPPPSLLAGPSSSTPSSLGFTPISSTSMPGAPGSTSLNGASTTQQDVATAILSHMNMSRPQQAQYSPTADHSVDPQLAPPLTPQGAPTPKPLVGSTEWHKQRRDNHKEVERRRRETINEGINELAKIVPGCEKNKGHILQRSIAYIQQLKETEQSNIDKWTLEKLLTEQAIAELSANNEKLKAEVERAWRESEAWKKACQSAGITRNDQTPTTSSS